MEVFGLFKLSDWFAAYGEPIIQDYQTLKQRLNHNATQPSKQPIRDEYDRLQNNLKQMPIAELTNQQTEFLDNCGIMKYLGIEGAKNVRGVVRSGQFDAASANSDVGTIISSLTNFQNSLQKLRNGLDEFPKLFEREDIVLADRVEVRLRFQGNAAMDDIAAVKKWSNEWYDIARGVAMCVDETPDNLKVVGAENGSIILTLAATASVTAVLVTITNHLTKVALNVLQIGNSIEDLRHKRILNRTIEDSLKDQSRLLAENGVNDALSAAKDSLPITIDGEQEAALKKSIEKLQKFTESGGETDFISPPIDDEVMGEDGEKGMQQIKIGIRELQDQRQELLLLTGQHLVEESLDDGAEPLLE